MINKTKRGLLFALLASLGMASATAQSIEQPPCNNQTIIQNVLQTSFNSPVTHFTDWYEQDQFNYTWTDASGVSHTSKFTDVATDPYQIYALLRMAYCNPNVPGSIYSRYTSSNVYYGSQSGGWGISSSDVTAPYEDGYTVFLVALKEYNGSNPHDTYSFSELINEINTNIESVELLTNGMRIGSGNNAGTVFNINGNYNRFFFIGKGKGKNWGYAPFIRMFEEFSASAPEDSAEPIDDFYPRMVAGEMYPVLHDCPTVIYLEHYFTMTGKDGNEKKSMTGLNFFIPDYRYNASDIWYSTSHQPQVGLYNIKLNASAELGSNETTCDVTLNWTSSLDQMAKETVPQSYTIYVVLTDEFGNETYQQLAVTPNPTGETTLTYTVPRTQNSYTINYIISGTPSDENYSNFFTWSNTASVVIPGLSANETMTLYLNHYESDYVANEESNYYRNLFNVKNENIVYGLTPDMVRAGHNKFDIYRYDNGNVEVGTVVAHITLSTSGNTVNYNISYDNQDILAGYSLSNLGIATSGSLGSYAGDAIINMGAIKICDQFSASTSTNSHPSRYDYALIEDTEEAPMFSNTVVVPVFKTASTIDGFYTLDEVTNDVEPSLTANVLNTNVEMTVSNNPSIYYYTLMRGVNAAPGEMISKLQHRTDGSYLEMLNVLNYENQVIDLEGVANKVVDRLDNNIVTGEPGNYISYLPVIWTFGNDRLIDNKDNSYGSPIWNTGVGSVVATTSAAPSASSYGKWYDEALKECTVFSPVITVNGNVPEMEDGVEYEPYMYRVWRICDGVRGYTIDAATGNYVNDPAADRSGQVLVAEKLTNEPTCVFGDDNALDFGALTDASIKFLVRFYYVKVGQNASEKPMYYVVEQLIDWNNNETAINEISDNRVISKTYYNSLGVASQTPFNGVNIVITRYSDGTTKSAKIVR